MEHKECQEFGGYCNNQRCPVCIGHKDVQTKDKK
jgi:hypothetical protein